MTNRKLSRDRIHPEMAGSILRLMVIAVCFVLLATRWSGAGESVITTGEGIAALGNDKTRNQTMNEARALAKRNAAEKAATYIQTSTEVEDFTLKQDLINAFSEAMVTIVEDLESSWLDDPQMGESYRIVIRAEVTPNMKKISTGGTGTSSWVDDPTAPLTVSLSCPKTNWAWGEDITFYLKGNKPFFARVVYEDCEGNLTQVLPNPYRADSYFKGGVTYSIPDGQDNYVLSVGAPFGKESVTVYASTKPLGKIAWTTQNAVYKLIDKREKVATQTRGIHIQPKNQTTGKTPEHNDTAEFFETTLTIHTGPAQ